MQVFNNFIAGEYVPPMHGLYLDNENPATAEVYSKVADSTKEDALSAIKAAKNAFNHWATSSLKDRSEILMNLASEIRNNRNELAQMESLDNGKTLKQSLEVEIPRAALNFEFFAQNHEILKGEKVPMPGAINHILRHPLGVVTCISPWNLPLYLFTWKIAPALMAGNTVIGKPSEFTPATATILGDLANKAGLPPGVLNIVNGQGSKLGPSIVGHDDIQAISFTGSTATGRIIGTLAAERFKKHSLEMGGKNPAIIFSDCDFETTVSEVVRAAFSNSGQICLCGSRIYIERPIYERFKIALIEKTKALKVGDPFYDDSDLGPLVSRPHFEKVLGYLELAQQEGGRFLTGGKAPNMPGYFIEPTIIEGLSTDCETNQEEIFGPVISIMPFDKQDEVIKLANSTRYGLSASIWTEDLERGKQVASKIQAGVVWINTWLKRELSTPFGGMKDSGVGREGGRYILEFFTTPQTICVEGEQ